MHLWIGRFNFVKMSILPEVIYTFSDRSVKVSMPFFFRNRNYSKIKIEFQRTAGSEKEEQSLRSHNYGFQNISQSYSNKNISVLA